MVKGHHHTGPQMTFYLIFLGITCMMASKMLFIMRYSKMTFWLTLSVAVDMISNRRRERFFTLTTAWAHMHGHDQGCRHDQQQVEREVLHTYNMNTHALITSEVYYNTNTHALTWAHYMIRGKSFYMSNTWQPRCAQAPCPTRDSHGAHKHHVQHVTATVHTSTMSSTWQLMMYINKHRPPGAHTYLAFLTTISLAMAST